MQRILTNILPFLLLVLELRWSLNYTYGIPYTGLIDNFGVTAFTHNVWTLIAYYGAKLCPNGSTTHVLVASSPCDEEVFNSLPLT
jgi:hypothetical protein